MKRVGGLASPLFRLEALHAVPEPVIHLSGQSRNAHCSVCAFMIQCKWCGRAGHCRGGRPSSVPRAPKRASDWLPAIVRTCTDSEPPTKCRDAAHPSSLVEDGRTWPSSLVEDGSTWPSSPTPARAQGADGTGRISRGLQGRGRCAPGTAREGVGCACGACTAPGGDSERARAQARGQLSLLNLGCSPGSGPRARTLSRGASAGAAPDARVLPCSSRRPVSTAPARPVDNRGSRLQVQLSHYLINTVRVPRVSRW
jgi:hypothetical protein